MFFSVKELSNYLNDDPEGAGWLALTRRAYRLPQGARISNRVSADFLRKVKMAVVSRDTDVVINGYRIGIMKWIRPWMAVPQLKVYSVPDGEYAVGVEIEMGFRSREAASRIASLVQNWKHLALDYEGGTHPIEATFAPVLYKKFNKSQAVRYTKILQENLQLVEPHNPRNYVGTHVNVSKGGASLRYERVTDVNRFMASLTPTQNEKYFGRQIPYRLGVPHRSYIEFKMFNSTTDYKHLKRYANIAVALAELVYGTQLIMNADVIAALDKGYNKRV